MLFRKKIPMYCFSIGSIAFKVVFVVKIMQWNSTILEYKGYILKVKMKRLMMTLKPFYCRARKDHISINCSLFNSEIFQYFYSYTRHCMLQLADVNYYYYFFFFFFQATWQAVQDHECWCGLFGRSGINELLKIWRAPWIN